MTDDRLSDAVVAYFSKGRSPFPKEDPGAVLAMGVDGSALLDQVRAVRAEAWATPVDWATTDLAGAWDVVVAHVARARPDLSPAALDALAWAFTYAMR